jgi:hypothetical protein
VFFATLIAIGFCIVVYFSLQAMASINKKLNIIQKELNNLSPDKQSLLRIEDEYLVDTVSQNIIEHTIKNLKSELDSIKSELKKTNEDLLTDRTVDTDIEEQLEQIKNGLLKIEKYFINQFKFNDVLAKEISHNKYDMTYIMTKLIHKFPTTNEERKEIHYSALQSIFSSYPKSTPYAYFPRDDENEYCVIYLDFSNIAPTFRFNEEIDAKTLIRACMGYKNEYYINCRDLIYGAHARYCSSEQENNELNFDEYSHIDPESKYVLKKGISVCAHIFEKKIGGSASYDMHYATIISVKKNIVNEYRYDVILSMELDDVDAEGWFPKKLVTKKFTINDFPCVVDEQYVIKLMSIDPEKSPAPTEFFGIEGPLPSGFDPKKPTLIQYGDGYWFYGNTIGNSWKTQKLESQFNSIIQPLYIDFSTCNEMPLHHYQSMSIWDYIKAIQGHTHDEG